MWKLISAITLLVSVTLVKNEVDKFPCFPNSTRFNIWYNNTDCTGKVLYAACSYPIKGIELNGDIASESIPARDDEFLSARVLGTIRTTFITESNQSYVSYVIGYEPNGTKCLTLKDLISLKNWDDYTFNRTVNFGSPNSPSQLFFTKEINFQGEYHWVTLEEKGIGSRYPFTAKSYIHASNDTWVIYKEKEFTGEITCFYPMNKTTKATEVRKTNISLIVGSVKKDTEGICENSGGFGSRLIPGLNFAIIAFAGILSL